MAEYEYKGKTLAGAQVSGVIKAKDQQDLERVLRRNRIIISSVRKKPTQLNIKFGTGIRRQDISRFTRQFATMIGSGLPMIQCLEILASQVESKELRKVIIQIKDSVQGGSTLADALARHPKVFDQLYSNMVEAGEMGGALDVILLRLAAYREKADALIRKVRGAMMYPSIIVVVAVGVVFAMLTFVVPVFAKMFRDLGGQLPTPTLVVMAVSNFLKSNILFFVIGLIALAIAYKLTVRTPGGRLAVDKVKINMPILGTLIRKSAISRFSRTLGTLLSSGVSILEALEITARTAGNRVVHDAIKRSIVSIAEGDTITAPLKDSGVFPPMVTQMIAVGEKTGGLDEMLNKIADFYDEEVDAAVAALTSIIEPVVIVFMGIIIGGVMIAMYLPMFDIIGKIG